MFLLLGIAFAGAPGLAQRSSGCVRAPAGSAAVFESDSMMPEDCTSRCAGAGVALVGPLSAWRFECVCVSVAAAAAAGGCAAPCPGAPIPSSAPKCGGWDAAGAPVYSAYAVLAPAPAPNPIEPTQQPQPQPPPPPPVVPTVAPSQGGSIARPTSAVVDQPNNNINNNTQIQAQPGGIPVPAPFSPSSQRQPDTNNNNNNNNPTTNASDSTTSSAPNQTALIAGIVGAAIVLAIGFTIMNTKPRRRARLVNGVIIVGGEGSDDEGAIDNVQDLKTVVDFYYESEAQIVEVPPPNYREGGGGGEDGNNYGSRRQSMIDYLQLPQLRNLLVGGSNSSSVILEEETAGADGGEADEHTHHSDSSTSTAAITDPLPGTAPRDLQEDMSLFSNNTQQQQQQQQQSPFPFENNESIIDVLRTRSIASTRPSMMSLDSALEFRRGSVGRFEVDVEDVMSTYEFDTDIVIEGVEAVNANVALARASMMLGGFDGHEAE